LNLERNVFVFDCGGGAAGAGLADLKLETLNRDGLFESLAAALLFFPRIVGTSSIEPLRNDWRMLARGLAGGEEDRILHFDEAGTLVGD